jgi:hypothetical protein
MEPYGARCQEARASSPSQIASGSPVQLDRVIDQRTERLPDAAELLEEAGPDITAFSSLPLDHWPSLVEQRAGAAAPRDPPADRRGRHLPQPRRDHPPWWVPSSPSNLTSVRWPVGT